MVYMYAQLYWTLPHKTMWKCFSEQYTIGNSHKKPLNVSISVSVWSSGHQLGICWTKHCFHDKLWCSKAALKKAPEDVCKFHHFDPPPSRPPPNLTRPFQLVCTWPIARPLQDFILQLWRKIGSGSGLATGLCAPGHKGRHQPTPLDKLSGPFMLCAPGYKGRWDINLLLGPFILCDPRYKG